MLGAAGEFSRCFPSSIGENESVVSDGPPKVAVIDDEPAIREVLEIGLGQEGFEVRSAVDGQAGLALVTDWRPDCVVLDLMLPKIDGIALIPELRRVTEVPIVMLTALGTVRDRVGGLQAGADDYVVKPFDLPELAVRLHAALRRPRLRDVRYLRFKGIELDLEARQFAVIVHVAVGPGGAGDGDDQLVAFQDGVEAGVFRVRR